MLFTTPTAWASNNPALPNSRIRSSSRLAAARGPSAELANEVVALREALSQAKQEGLGHLAKVNCVHTRGWVVRRVVNQCMCLSCVSG